MVLHENKIANITYFSLTLNNMQFKICSIWKCMWNIMVSVKGNFGLWHYYIRHVIGSVYVTKERWFSWLSVWRVSVS